MAARPCSAAATPLSRYPTDTCRVGGCFNPYRIISPTLGWAQVLLQILQKPLAFMEAARDNRRPLAKHKRALEVRNRVRRAVQAFSGSDACARARAFERRSGGPGPFRRYFTAARSGRLLRATSPVRAVRRAIAPPKGRDGGMTLWPGYKFNSPDLRHGSRPREV